MHENSLHPLDVRVRLPEIEVLDYAVGDGDAVLRVVEQVLRERETRVLPQEPKVDLKHHSLSEEEHV